MATPTTTARRAQGFGAERFLVRGADFASEQSLAIIRPAITDYPERVTQNPLFPYPGRRGGSRPRPEDLERSTLPHNPIFPQPRPRDVPAGTAYGGILPAPGSALASPVLTCLGDGGIHIQRGALILTTVTDAVVTVQFARPFVVRFVSFFCDTTDVLNISARFLLATNNNVSAGFTSDGVQLDEGSIGAADFIGVADTQVSYPNKRWTTVPAFIKLIVRNLTAGTINIQWIVDIEWLD
jgi:hypothetical protein